MQERSRWITFWNVMAMVSTDRIVFFVAVVIASFNSVASCASVEIWPSLLLVVPRISSIHKKKRTLTRIKCNAIEI